MKINGMYVGEIRNKVIAHKDPDVTYQTEVMTSVDNTGTAKLGFTLFELNRKPAKVYTNLMNGMAGMKNE